MPVRRLDVVVSAILVFFGAWVVYKSLGYGLTSEVGPDSGTFPFIGGVLIAVFSALNLLRFFFQEKHVEGLIVRKEVVQTAIIIALIIIYIESVRFAGMLLPLPFLLMAISLAIDWRTDVKWLLALAFGSIVLSVACYFVFADFLNILMPDGPFGL